LPKSAKDESELLTLAPEPEKPSQSEDDKVADLLSLKRIDKSELKVAIDGDLNYQFTLRAHDGKKLKLVNGLQTDGVRAYVWPHETDVTLYAARGYRVEKYGPTSVRPAGVTVDAELAGKQIKVLDHVCCSLPVGEWRKQKLAEMASGDAFISGKIQAESAPIVVSTPPQAGA